MVPTAQNEGQDDTDILAAELELEDELEQQDTQSSFMDDEHSPGPSSSVSQNFNEPSQYARPTTSDIWSQVTLERQAEIPYIICNHCSKRYKRDGGTRVVREHLKRYNQ